MGIHVQATDFTHISIQCRNYPNSDEKEDFDPFHSNLDATLSQITDINTHFPSDDEDDIFDFVLDNVSV